MTSIKLFIHTFYKFLFTNERRVFFCLFVLKFRPIRWVGLENLEFWCKYDWIKVHVHMPWKYNIHELWHCIAGRLEKTSHHNFHEYHIVWCADGYDDDDDVWWWQDKIRLSVYTFSYPFLVSWVFGVCVCINEMPKERKEPQSIHNAFIHTDYLVQDWKFNNIINIMGTMYSQKRKEATFSFSKQTQSISDPTSNWEQRWLGLTSFVRENYASKWYETFFWVNMAEHYESRGVSFLTKGITFDIVILNIFFSLIVHLTDDTDRLHITQTQHAWCLDDKNI